MFVEPTNWAVRRFLKRFKRKSKVQTLANLAAEQAERAFRVGLKGMLPVSDKRYVRYGEDGCLKHREVDAIVFDDEGVVLYEHKLTDDRDYAKSGLEQLRTIRQVLTQTGYHGRIRLRLVVTSNRVKCIKGLAQETWLGDTEFDEAVVRIPTAVLASYANEAGISLPPSWDDARTRFASRALDYRPRRKAVTA
jgi:IS1 family transposase